MNSYNKLQGKNIDKIQNKKEIPEQLQSEFTNLPPLYHNQ